MIVQMTIINRGMKFILHLNYMTLSGWSHSPPAYIQGNNMSKDVYR